MEENIPSRRIDKIYRFCVTCHKECYAEELEEFSNDYFTGQICEDCYKKLNVSSE